jgi:hypothetical protein
MLVEVGNMIPMDSMLSYLKYASIEAQHKKHTRWGMLKSKMNTKDFLQPCCLECQFSLNQQRTWSCAAIEAQAARSTFDGVNGRYPGHDSGIKKWWKTALVGGGDR